MDVERLFHDRKRTGRRKKGKYLFYVSDNPAKFKRIGRVFLRGKLDNVKLGRLRGD